MIAGVMVALANYRGYTLCKNHPGIKAKYGAFQYANCWFESDDYDNLKLLIDEALDADA